jgi:hypothetical protein
MNENVFGKGVGVKIFFGGRRESRDNLEYLLFTVRWWPGKSSKIQLEWEWQQWL